MTSLTLGENALFEYAKPINFVQVLGDKAPLFREEAPYVIHNRLYCTAQRKIIMKITRTVGKIKLKHSKSATFSPGPSRMSRCFKRLPEKWNKIGALCLLLCYPDIMEPLWGLVLHRTLPRLVKQCDFIVMPVLILS